MRGNRASPRPLDDTVEELEGRGRRQGRRLVAVTGAICALWALFQLWIASPLPFTFDFGIIVDVPARGIHLAAGLLLCFLIYPATKGLGARRLPLYDVILALAGAGAAAYLFFGYEGLVRRQGVLLTYDLSPFGIDAQLPVEALLGGVGIVVLLEAVRRSIGLPLVIVCGLFLAYSVFGQSMPDIISHKGVSLTRLIGYQWLSGEAVFGIPISVSVDFVFLFVLFGALMDTAGAGKYFLDIAFALVGRFRGGPAKAAILSSGMVGMISGSSIANVVTTGTFTIPVMRRTGFPAEKAGAIEVAASTNGQIMPPIMGAAAFIMAEFIGISYFDVVVAAFIPAVVSYIALLYISHLEALKLGLVGLPAAEIPPLRKTLVRGLHYLIPIAILLYLLMVKRWTAKSAVFYSIVAMMAIVVLQHLVLAVARREVSVAQAAARAVAELYTALVAGARNMVSIAVAVAAAGIVVGSVSSTGLNNAMVGVVEAIAGGNVYILLGLTAVLCLVLGMGLPTTANYIVVASLLANVLVELGGAAGLVLPLIAVHLFVFYFGILADDTPPVCLAAFAASAISRGDPLKTGVQSFMYDIRTAILPFVFIFNPELLLVGVESFWHAAMIFGVSLIAILSFSALTQGWMLTRLTLWERLLLVVVVVALFRPGVFMDRIYPPYAAVPLAKFAAGETVIAEPGRNVRLHVIRETNYGDRPKLFVLESRPNEEGRTAAAYGLTIASEADGRYAVADLAVGGLAERVGVDFGDYVTGVDVERPGQPPKSLVYPFGLALLGLVVLTQLRRRRAAG